MKSLLDNDFYKFTMQQAVLDLYPTANVTYKFINRGKQRFNDMFIVRFAQFLNDIEKLRFTDKEIKYLEDNYPCFKLPYLNYLSNYRFNSDQIIFNLDRHNNLDLIVHGPWHSTILWEVPLLAAISQFYFENVETNWKFNKSNYIKRTLEKNRKLQENVCYFSDFGTRRRRSFEFQDCVVETFANNNFSKYSKYGKYFLGTSNVHLAMKYEVKAVGTVAHEWTMAISALESLRNANRFALENWAKVYDNLGVALTDTYGIEAFFNNFDIKLSKLYNGVRQDSGDPIKFAERTIEHYKKYNIDPLSKTIVFSNALTAEGAIKINNFCVNKIKCAFGIGTHFSNNIPGSLPLNIVIKLNSVNDIPVVKLSEDKEKETGDKSALKEARYVFFGEPLEK
jgi:nicotinate phosphoribosyltransferase